jgi:hypothetical protein
VGMLMYADTAGIQVEDRLLEHIRLAVGQRLRRGESFMLNLTTDDNGNSLRRNLWISPSIPLQFVAFGSRTPQINRTWVQAMGDTEDSTGTMTVMTEAESIEYFEHKHTRLMSDLHGSRRTELIAS